MLETRKSQRKLPSKTEHQRTKTLPDHTHHQTRVSMSDKNSQFRQWEEDNKIKQLELF